MTPLKGARFVGGKDEAEWSARDVANAVLTDRSVGRIATGERYNLEDIDAVRPREHACAKRGACAAPCVADTHAP